MQLYSDRQKYLALILFILVRRWIKNVRWLFPFVRTKSYIKNIFPPNAPFESHLCLLTWFIDTILHQQKGKHEKGKIRFFLQSKLLPSGVFSSGCQVYHFRFTLKRIFFPKNGQNIWIYFWFCQKWNWSNYRFLSFTNSNKFWNFLLNYLITFNYVANT